MTEETYQNLLGVAYPPRQLPDIPVCRNNARRKLDTKHVTNCIDNPSCVLVISLQVAAKRLINRIRRNIWIPIQTVPDNGQQCGGHSSICLADTACSCGRRG